MSRPLKVNELTRYIDSLLTTDPILKSLEVQGELRNLRCAKYIYFDLQDDQALLHCAIFDIDAMRSFHLKEGDEVILSGRISTYAKGGQYQFLVKGARGLGRGEKLEALEQLKKKLYQEGLFDTKRKKHLQVYPKSLGLITSRGGAVLHDFANEVNRRYPVAHIIVYHSSVQGEESVSGIIEGIRYFNDSRTVDTIIIARGGGAAEHLDSYNDEKLVRAVFSSKIPIITAIGHQVDNSLVDLASDSRASTPTEAAILATPDKFDLKRVIDERTLQIDWSIQAYFQKLHRNIDQLMLTLQRYSPLSKLQAMRRELSALQLNISNVTHRSLSDRRKVLAELLSGIDEQYEILIKPERWWLENKEGKRLSSPEVKKGMRYLLVSDSVKLQILVEEKVKLNDR